MKKNKKSYTLLDDVSKSIERALKRDKKSDYALDILSNIDTNTDWKKLAEENIYIEFIDDASSTIGGSFTTIGKNNILIGQLSNMSIGNSTKVIKSSSNIFKVKLNNKDTFDEKLFSEIKDSLKTNMMATNKNQIFNQWLKSEKDAIEIKDLRSRIF